MNLLKTLVGWGSSAWDAIFGAGSNPISALQKLWRFIASIHNLFSWLTSGPLLTFGRELLKLDEKYNVYFLALRDALHRLRGWLWLTLVAPAIARVYAAIAALRAYTVRQLALTWLQMIRFYILGRAYAAALTKAEHAAMLKAVAAEHAAMVKAVKAAIATVNQQAASGYNSGVHDRLGTVTKLLDDIAVRNPLVKDAVNILVGAVLDLETVDNPLARFLIGKLLTQIIDRAGVDAAIGNLVQQLLGPLTGQPRANGLYQVEKDVSDRLGALEGQWASFMAGGGPEVEQAGKGWRDISGLAVDAGLLGVFALAVTDPAAWATGMAGTVGVVAGDTLTVVVDVLNQA